jgi:hypothetical protein
MAVTIKPYQKKVQYEEASDSTGSKILGVLGGIAGGVAGAMTGTPMGVIGGASAGASLGGSIGGAVDPATAGGRSGGGQAGYVQQDESAMQRRLGKSQEDRLAVLRQSEAALAQLPKELREEYAAPIVAATMAEEKKRAMGMG